MVENEDRRKNWRPIMVVLGLLLGALLTAGAAFASLPASVPAGVAAGPPMQGKADQGQQQQQQAEDPSKGKLGPVLPDTISIDGKPQESVSGGTPLPTPCGPSSIYFELEPNNTITTAHVLGSKNNAEVRGAINSAGDIDYYSFVANAGDRIWAYAFTLGAVSSTDTQLQLLDALSNTLQFDDDNGSQADLSSAIAGKVVTQTATYYLRVNAFSSTSTVMPYTLFIDRTSTAPVPEVEPNNTFTQPNPYVVGSVVTGTINVTTDLDVYSFEFFDDDRYVFQVDGDPERDGTEFNPNFDLMNAAGAVLVTVDSDSQFDAREINSENAAFFIDTGGPPTATLLLRVRPEGATTGTYALHIWRVGEVPCGNSPTPTVTNTATPVCNTFISEVEPNGTFTTAQTLPTLNDLEVRAPIQPAGDIDYYTGNATAGDKIWAYLFTGSSTSGTDSELRILNAVSTTIQFDDDNGSQAAASSNISGAPITTTGAIYFRLNEFNNDGTITPYSLFIDRTSSTPNVTEVEPNDVFTQANMVAIDDLITGTIALTTDLDVFGFTAGAGDRIIFQVDGDPERDGVQYDPLMQILDSAGTQLVSVDSSSPLGDRISESHVHTFGAAGTYYVRLRSDTSLTTGGSATGSYNLHLWKTASPPCASATPAATNTVVPPTFTATTIVTSTNTVVVTSTNTVAATGTATVVQPTATVCVAATPFQEVEPNNTITNANTLANISGAEVRGGITPAGDQDFFSFQANAGDRIWSYINTSNASPSTDSILTLVNATGGVYQLDDDNGFQSTLSSAIAGGVITQTGTAGLGVRQFGGATIMSPYSLYINRTTGAAIPEVEPNNVFTQANAYSFGTVVTGSIPISTDLDYFVFTLALNEKIVIQVDGDPDRNGTNLSRVNQFNPNFDLLDANGAPITAVDSDSQGGNGGLLSENLVFTNTNILSTTFGVRIKFDPSTPVEDDLGIYNLHIYKVGGGAGCPTTTPTVGATSTVGTVLPTNTAGTPSATVCVPSSGTWVAVATAPAPGRYNVSGVVGTDGKFYVMTGQDSANAPVANNDVFDPVTNAWSSASPVPSPIQAHPALGSVAGKIYMSGGSVASTPVATTRIYDIAANSWTTGTNAPTAFRAAEYATHGGNLYVFGGIDAAGVPLTTTMIYSTTANSWSMGAPLPDVKFYGFAAESGGMIYLYGGANNTAVNSTLWRYNPATNTFTILAPGPNARIRLAMSARDGKLYATGGSTTPGNSFAQTNTVDVYDIATNTWSAGPNMIAPRNTHVQGTLPDGRIIAAVGLTTGNVRTQSAEVLPRGTGCPTPSVVPTTGATNTVPPTVAATNTVAATVTTGVSPTVCVANPVNLVLDDGTVENSVGWTNSTMNFTAIWINRSSPPAASFPMNLTNISIKWPNSAALVGKTIALLVYSDTDGDGDPSDAVKVAQVNGQTITVANGTTFQDFPVNVNIPTAGDVYYGFADTYNSGGVSPRTFPAPLDTTATQGRSWVAAQDGTEDPDFDNLGNNDNLGTIDALSGGALTGNWVIRASGTGGGGCPTGTVVATITAGPTATCVPVAGGWSQGALLPVPLVRAWGVYFPPNGKLYAMGGRTADGTGTAQLNPLEYTPSTNTWITKTAVFSDQQTSNVQGGYLTMSGTPVIVVVGGSAGGGTGGTTETRIYNPVADTLTTLTTDPWTPGTTTVPGGSAVWNNKLYIFGGFDIPGAIASDEIWEFDPARAAGSRWVLKNAVLPTPLAYIPAATIGNFIYTGGGSLIEGGTLSDSDLAFRYDPAADTITTIASLPNVTAETRGVAFNGELWVLGGGRTAPNPSSNVLIYTPGSNTWRSGPSFVLARRNFPADTDGVSKIWLAGGYAPSAPTDNMEIFTQGVICGSPTVTSTPVASNTATRTITAVSTATRTATRTSTSVATNTTGPTSTSTTVPPTSCPLAFVDVPPSNEFYTYIRCLVCRFIISGYNDRTFRPNNNIIRGQIAKMVSNSAGFDEDPGAQIYEDVPPSNEFYPWINRLTMRGVMSGYPCGSNVYEPCGPQNRPYFRWNANATRGQISQIVARGAGITDPPGDQRYTDVPPTSTFFIPIQQLSNMGVMSGYPCGGTNPQTGQAEPCDSENRPYFRPNNLATRAQASKIVANTFFPGCVTPGGPLNSDANLPNVNMLRSAQPVAPAKPASND